MVPELGGTGATEFDEHALLIGQGTDPFTTAVATQDGQILIGFTNADPNFVTPTVGAGLSLQSDAQTLQLNLQIPVQVSSGGTGHVALNAHAVFVGQDDQSLGIVTPSMTSGVPLISQGAFADPIFGTVTVAGGGTGQTTFPRTMEFCLVN